MGTEMGQSEAKPERQSQVTVQINNLERGLPTLHEKIGTLVDRLSPVLRSSVPSEQAEGKDNEELVVLASTIEGFVSSVKSAACKIEDILERLEL